MIVRPTATAVPFSVCSDLGLAAVRPHAGCPGAAPGSRSCSRSRSARGSAPGRAATPRSRTCAPPTRRGRRSAMSTTRYGMPSSERISSSIASSRSCSAGDSLGRDEAEHLDLVELVHAEDPARVAARGARPRGGSTARSRRSAAAPCAVEDLAGVQRGERDLGRADEVQVVLGQVVDLLLGVGQHARAVQRLLADEHRRDDRLEALARAASPAPSARARARGTRGRRAGRRSASPTGARRAPCRCARRRARGGRGRSSWPRRPRAGPCPRRARRGRAGCRASRAAASRSRSSASRSAPSRLTSAGDLLHPRDRRRRVLARPLGAADLLGGLVLLGAQRPRTRAIAARQRSSSSSQRSSASALPRRAGPARRAPRRGRGG